MLEPAYRATEDIVVKYPDGFTYIHARKGTFLTVEEAEHLGLLEEPAEVRTAAVAPPEPKEHRRARRS